MWFYAHEPHSLSFMHKKMPATPQDRKMRPRINSSSVAFKVFIIIVLVLMGGAVLRYLEENHILEQMKFHALEKDNMQEALGWGSELKIDKKAEPLTKIRFMLRNRDHAPIRGATVMATLSHAAEYGNILTQSSFDLPLTMVEPGVYRGQTHLPQPGDWNVLVNARIGQNTYQINERVTLP